MKETGAKAESASDKRRERRAEIVHVEHGPLATDAKAEPCHEHGRREPGDADRAEEAPMSMDRVHRDNIGVGPRSLER